MVWRLEAIELLHYGFTWHSVKMSLVEVFVEKARWMMEIPGQQSPHVALGKDLTGSPLSAAWPLQHIHGDRPGPLVGGSATSIRGESATSFDF